MDFVSRKKRLMAFVNCKRLRGNEYVTFQIFIIYMISKIILTETKLTLEQYSSIFFNWSNLVRLDRFWFFHPKPFKVENQRQVSQRPSKGPIVEYCRVIVTNRVSTEQTDRFPLGVLKK